MPRILVHICCAPCFIYPYKVLKQEGFSVFGLFFNPNIHPYLEFKKRLNAVRELESMEQDLKIIYHDNYDLEKFLQSVVFRENIRCNHCYNIRLEKTAIVARRGKFDNFTTTLLYSKQQKHQIICDIATSLGKKYGVPFLYKNFSEGWKEGILDSKRLNLYRQTYCGCIYSEKERYYHPNNTIEIQERYRREKKKS